MDGLTLEKLAEQTDLDTNAIRFYEQLGLLISLTESDSLQQLYTHIMDGYNHKHNNSFPFQLNLGNT